MKPWPICPAVTNYHAHESPHFSAVVMDSAASHARLPIASLARWEPTDRGS
jgi:hypothetical protein